ncbi:MULTISPECIES: DUF2802 domain-containing protein [Rhodanobacter]|uniref:DUF2802 domain-containing protein n=1 Tax=Rhodanobacter hydrolyticus TaxID=2250595 RepID=A0ABW8J8H9_9GAMM|nr:DUF2802 domain-containing protein [Rhodanobacter sp. 7MK24]MBD8881938.1 DUF2802 domain-containing protein [Rhodanobacter sp. 7MK24]
MLLESGVLALLLLAVGQMALLVKLWRQSHRLQQRVDALWRNAADAGTDVPTSMLVTALDRVERKLGQVERPVLPERSWELAKQLAREGADVEQLVACCGLSRDEAQLILAMRTSMV